MVILKVLRKYNFVSVVIFTTTLTFLLAFYMSKRHRFLHLLLTFSRHVSPFVTLYENLLPDTKGIHGFDGQPRRSIVTTVDRPHF